MVKTYALKPLNISSATKTMKATSSKQLISFILNNFVLFNVFTCATGQEAEHALPCSIDIRRDLPMSNQSQPLYLKPKSSEYWHPNTEGYLQVPHGRCIELVCTGPFANVTVENGTQSLNLEPHIRTICPRCLQGTTFLLNDDQYEFRHFVCAQKVKYTAERTTQGCANNTAETYRIGYNLTDGRFVQTLLACYDPAQIRTHYTEFVLDSANARFQTGVKRSRFSKVDYFKIDMNYLYSQKNQHAQAAKVFGSTDMAMTYFDSKLKYLSRGHLTAKADKIYATEQQTTFNFFNVAAQWQPFNGVSWAKMEDKMRQYLAENQRTATCYSGTYGTMHFTRASDNMSVPFFLAQDENNNDVIAVPQQFYRICTVGSNVGLAILGVNNIHATSDEILKYLLCDDVSEQVPWLSWIRSEQLLEYGYLYACRVSELVKKVPELPAHLGGITELLV
ncbi:PREDICTED: uncharacterized protein LOC108358476 [Rhagoletis zephyria]|uniref:uncharacterized protein LOC108358476 n=1 Tax=Rhagoletis zephyria TaxID=28612 RepID=UPI000811699B|nr:PREDICTED: uncharacterized protein LOC108358476 [Rhagoletis zephyria]